MSGRAWAVAALILLAPRHARADDAKAFRLAFDAPAECPKADEMIARIQASSPRARLASPIEPAVDLGAELVPTSDGFMGYLRVRALDGAETTRSVPAKTCAESIFAMALIAVMVIDPDAVTTAPEAPPSPNEVTAATDAPNVERAESPPARASEPHVVPWKEYLDRGNDPDREASRVPPADWWLVTGDAGLLGAIAPDVAPDFGLVGYLDTRPRVLAPLLRLSARWASSGSTSAEVGGRASFRRIGESGSAWAS